MNTIQDLEQRLETARERLNRACQAMAPKHKGGEWEEYWSAQKELLILERQVASAKGEEYAETIDFPARWDGGAPMPQLFVNDNRALLAFVLLGYDPNWDGSYVTIKNAASEEADGVALVEFEHCVSAKLGDPNDEVFEGHPLNGKGLEAYGAQRVVNSHWLKELEATNSVHRQYRPESWRDLNHYIFWFHDSTFECVARTFRVETYREPMKALLARMVARLIG